MLTWLTSNGKEGDAYPGKCVTPEASAASPVPIGSPDDLAFMGGMFGQIVMAIPSHHAVAVTPPRPFLGPY